MKRIIFTCLLSTLFVISSAQKVGLVLSGGGAKGLAHIGVIRALEENGIPVDYVAGTSMGAIISGLYAAGYSPQQMEEIFLSEEFPQWISGQLNEKYIFYFKQPEPNASWIDLRFNSEKGIKPLLPTNIVSPFQMDYAFLQIFAGANAVCKGNFDSLFVPFRCVASDINANAPVVLRKGDVGNAIRASMTFPFYFRPIRIDGKLLFDGGMYNNFPSNVMYDDFLPDIIIGSKVAGNYSNPEDDNLVSQIQSMLMEKTDYSVTCENGILIEPTLKQVNVIDFSYAKEFIDSGYVATIRKIKQIKESITDSVSPDSINSKRRSFTSRFPEPTIDSIIIDGLNKKQKSYIYNQLLLNKEEVSIDKMKSGYFRLLADNKIQYMFPRIQFDTIKNKFNLHLDIKRDNTLVTEFGGNISSSPINEAFIQVNYKYLSNFGSNISANTYIGRFYNSVEVRARNDYPSGVPFYLEAVISYNQWDFFKTKTYFFEDKNPSYLVQTESYIGVSLGLPWGNKSKINISIAKTLQKDDYYQTNTFNRSDEPDKTYFKPFAGTLLFEKNSLNKKQFATQGTQVLAKTQFITGTEEFNPGSTAPLKSFYEKKQRWIQAKLLYDKYVPVSKFYTFGFYLEGFYSSQHFYQNYTSSVLSSGIFNPTPESKTLFISAYRANQYLAGGIKNLLKISKSAHFRLEGYIFQPYQEILQDASHIPYYGKRFSKRYFSASGALVIHTMIGPLSISANYYQGYEDPFSIIFNFGYILFNSKSID